MTANDPEPDAVGRSWRTKLAALTRFMRRLPIAALLALGVGVSLVWVIFLCWAAYSLLAILVG